jgi:hypothetical protein
MCKTFYRGRKKKRWLLSKYKLNELLFLEKSLQVPHLQACHRQTHDDRKKTQPGHFYISRYVQILHFFFSATNIKHVTREFFVQINYNPARKWNI